MYLFLVIFSKYRYHTSLFNLCMTKGNLIQKASRHVLKQFMVVFGDHAQWEWDRREAEDNGNISEDNRDER